MPQDFIRGRMMSVLLFNSISRWDVYPFLTQTSLCRQSYAGPQERTRGARLAPTAHKLVPEAQLQRQQGKGFQGCSSKDDLNTTVSVRLITHLASTASVAFHQKAPPKSIISSQ